MKNLTHLSSDFDASFDFPLAADARMSRVNYVDDQAWQVELGQNDAAALAFQTAYGGRASLVSIVPMWRVAGRQVYQARHYAAAPRITRLAPNFYSADAMLAPKLKLAFRFWIMESQAAGGDLTLANRSGETIELQLDLFAHVLFGGRKRKLNVLTLRDGSLALHLGAIGDINPVLTLDGASINVYGGRISSPKLGCILRLEPGESQRLRFVTAGLPEMRDSLSLAQNWLARPWQPFMDEIDALAAATPQIQTGNAAWDRLIAYCYNTLVKSFMQSAENESCPAFVAFRAINRGYSRRGDGSDHMRGWDGQDPRLAWLVACAAATIAPDHARDILRQCLASVKQPDRLMLPLLARLAWTLNEARADREFIAECYPGLLAHFERWLANDADNDGAPEWQSERQMGYVAFPTFGRAQGLAQGADVSLMETPDLLAYLISEADALRSLAQLVDEPDQASRLKRQRDNLLATLADFWDGDRYAYRDRDTHESSAGLHLLRHGAGDAIHQIERALKPPQRLIIRVVGGLSHVPALRLRLTGDDAAGNALEIKADVAEFDWHQRQGIYVSPQPLSYVGQIEITGLSRVYKVYAATVDCARLDINHLLPLFTGRLHKERAEALAALAMDENHFLCRNGIAMVSRQDSNFDPSNARGGGGIWMFWLSLIGEGMDKSGFRAEATRMLKRVMDFQSELLLREKSLSQFYHADEIQGFGEAHHVGGLLPLKLLHDIIGIHIRSATRVQVGGEFTWGQPVSVRQHGVLARRDSQAITIDFPSGESLTLPANAPWQTVDDPQPSEAEAPTSELPEPPAHPDNDADARIEIDIDAPADGDDSAPPESEPDP